MAETKLDTLQASGGLGGVWNADVQASLLGLNTEGPADAQVAALSSSDKDHLQQAQQAQAYVKAAISSGGATVSQPNPFSSYSYKSLAAVITDKTGAYTDYEKSAAFYAFNDKQNAWVSPLLEQAQRTGDYTPFYTEGIKQYNSLPDVIKATYPPGYLTTITSYANGSLGNRGAQVATDEGDASASKDPILALFEALHKQQNKLTAGQSGAAKNYVKFLTETRNSTLA